MTYSLVMNDDRGAGGAPGELRGARLRRVVQRTLTSSLYLLISWPFQLAVFCISVTLVSLIFSIVLAPFVIPLAIAVASASAAIERRLVRSLVGLDLPPARRLQRLPKERLVDYFSRLVSNVGIWLELVWTLVAWIVSTITWVLTITWWSIAIAGGTWPAYGWTFHGKKDNQDLGDLLGLHTLAGASIVNFCVGLFFLGTLPAVMIGLARAQGLVSTAMLGRAEQEARIEELTQTRDAARQAEATQLSRLERDIHDGPQQRLVRLKMDLARMERQVGDDSHAILGLRAAIASTQDTLDELRALSKGIAPPVLADRGLVAAVREAAGRAEIPVTVEAELGEVILPPHLEQAAYFVVSEALTNIAKHSGARSGLVSLQVSGFELFVSVTDDGRGGAHPAKGSGIAGLQNRVRSVGGTLTLESPVGGPTTLLAVFPLT